MDKVIIRLDYSNGPIWKNHVNIETGDLKTGIDCVDNDITLQVLNDKACELYSSLYYFDKEDACVFDEVKFKAIQGQLLGLIKTIIYRLEEVNDGSFEIVDEETSNLEINSKVS